GLAEREERIETGSRVVGSKGSSLRREHRQYPPHLILVGAEKREAEQRRLELRRPRHLGAFASDSLKSPSPVLLAEPSESQGTHQQRPPVELARKVCVRRGCRLGAEREPSKTSPVAKHAPDNRVEADSVHLVVRSQGRGELIEVRRNALS